MSLLALLVLVDSMLEMVPAVTPFERRGDACIHWLYLGGCIGWQHLDADIRKLQISGDVKKEQDMASFV